MTEDGSKTIEELKARVRKLEEAVFGENKVETKPPMTTEIDVSGLGHVKQLESVLDKSIAVLHHLFSKNPNHQGLTPDEFALIFKEKFGMPIPLSTISSKLYGTTGTYVTRKKLSGRPIKYRYQILPKGQEYIRSKIATLQG